MTSMDDALVRRAAFDWLAAQNEFHGEVLSRTRLASGFEFRGDRVHVIGPQGIFKPRAMNLPLSITTSPNSPYNDAFGDDGLLRYRYRGTDPNHPDNSGLRHAMQQRAPLIYFHGLMPGRYLTVCPVYVVHDEPERLTFTVAVDDAAYANTQLERVLEGIKDDNRRVAEEEEERTLFRSYRTVATRVRIHQNAFRERVLRAYREQCAFCGLRHEELLDAAHIIRDADPEGEPTVRNGMALCKLHHATFDRFFVGVTPDYIIEVRRDIMDEQDGPMLLHGLKGLHNRRILVPRAGRDHPARNLLERRYEQFLAAS
jgi:putative restriction endonuclease